MKPQKRLAAAVLSLSMLLSLVGGGLADVSAARIVTTDSELAYEPLAQTASVAYERHEDGYTVSLDRAADSVTMNITAAPGAESGRAPEKARLYIHTGVDLKPDTTYQVSFSLSAERAQPEYAVCFDGGSAQAAYGALDGRSIGAGGTDQVKYLITPKQESGELVLCLLLGKTEAAGNALRFSGLAVGEAPENEIGENKVLVDKLDYNAPGAIRLGTSDGSKAVITSDETSATLTVTQTPAARAEVWKLKLLVATGVKPQAGKTYRVRFDVKSSASREFELCYNEGDAEKGYDVLYSQRLTGQKQTFDRRIYVPTDRENPGELILQLSLGKLSIGDKVTISNVRVEEAAAKYKNALARDFSYDSTHTFESYNPNNLIVTGSEDAAASVNWDEEANVTKSGDHAGNLTISGGEATLEINGGTDPWHARFNIDTGASLEAGKSYRVSFQVKTNLEYGSCEIRYGTALDGVDNNKAYGNQFVTLRTGAAQTVSYTVNPTSPGGLLISLWPGATGGQNNSVTVSGIKIEEVQAGTPSGNNLAAVDYPSGNCGSFSARDGAGIIIGDGNSATLICAPETDAAWKRGLFTGNVCQLEAGSTYEVSFDIQTDTNSFGFEVCYNKDGDWDASEKGFGWQGSLTASSTQQTVTQTINTTDKGAGMLRLRIDLGLAPKDTQVTVSNIQVTKTGSDGSNLASETYPTVQNFGPFEARDNFGPITGDGDSAAMTVSSGAADWQRALFVNNFCDLEAGKQYAVSFNIKADQEADYEVQFCEGDDKWNAGAFGTVSGKATSSGTEVKHTVTTGGSGKLTLRIDLKQAQDKNVTISSINVREIKSTSTLVASIGGFGSVWAEADTGEGYTANLTKNPDNAELKVEKTDPSKASGNWKAKLFIRTGVIYDADKAYRATFKISATNAQREFVVIYPGVPDTADIRGTWGLSVNAGETKTITTRPIPASNFTSAPGELILQLELGNLDGTENTFTVSDVKVEEVQVVPATVEARIDGAATFDAQSGYRADLICEKDSAALHITETPASGAEAWKMKMFLDTGVNPMADEAYRVTFDVLAENDMDFEVCYNRGNTEKGFDAIYGLHASGGKVKTVEKVFTAERPGRLKVQLSLGMVKAPNTVTVRNLRVERITYSSGRSALSSGMTYRAPGAVSFWAHEDYATTLTDSGSAITANITSAPQKGAEPWKVKLFLDTGAVLQAGKHYKVTANLSAKRSQDFEICYNNGGVEMGYDALGGLRLEGGKPQTVERIVSVPANKTDASNLMLQFNLGKTTAANAVTVSGVTVEEVAFSYDELIPEDFKYTAGRAVTLWTNPDYAATLEGADNSAAVHITNAPSTGAEVWKVKLLVNTGAMLSAGRTYLVRADLLAAREQNYEVCFNNEETEKGFDVLYGQTITAGKKTTVEKQISVPASMTDAGQLILQFSVGGSVTNDITVSNVSVRELHFGTDGGEDPAPDTVIGLYNAPWTAAGTLDVTREKLTYRMTKISSAGGDNAITIEGAGLRAGDLYTVAFTARADQNLTGAFALNRADGGAAVISEQFRLTPEEKTYSFTTKDPLSAGGAYDLLWQFGSADNQKLGGADVEISGISVYSPAENLRITHDAQNVTVNGKAVTPDAYNINGYNYFKLGDLAALLNDTDAQFVVRYNGQSNSVSLTTGKPNSLAGGKPAVGADRSASCVRSAQSIAVDGKPVNLKAYNIGGYNFLKLDSLDELLGFKLDYAAENDTVAIASPLTPEAQERAHDYDLFFLPEIDGASQPYVGDTMPYYENGTYYIYYLKEGGDSYNHSVYVVSTKDFVRYTELDAPVLSASREDVQDNWIGTGSVVKVDKTYYFFYTGFNASGSQEYHEKIMVAKGSSPTSFEKVRGWEIVPPAELGQKNDFRDPQAYYDPATQTISLTVTASQGGAARILKYTLGKDLRNAKYDGIIFTDPTGDFWNMECSDTFKIGNKWYLTYSGQDDTLWYAMADSRFGPYSAPVRLEGKLFYAAKHVEDGENAYMVGWARRSNSAASTQEVSGWAGNVVVQKLRQQKDGSLALVPVDSIVSGFDTQKGLALGASEASLTAGSGHSYKEAFTSYESFMLSGEFTYSGSGCFGLAFDFNGKEEQYKLISIDPAANKLSLSFDGGATPITETQAVLRPNQTHSFTYIQDGSVGVFYLDGQAALTVRLYGVTDKPIYLFAENNSVTFTSLRQYTP